MDDLWTCPHCGTSMKKMFGDHGVYRICEKCGCTVEGLEQRYESNHVCPNCHQEIEGNGECSYCGYDLGSDFE